MKTFLTLLQVFIYCIVSAQPVKVRDIIPGDQSGIYPGGLSMVAGNYYFFVTYAIPEVGMQLWRSDGTEEGTIYLHSFWSVYEEAGITKFLCVYDSVLYFSAATEETGLELWRSDGTPEGTYVFVDACPGGCSIPAYHDTKSGFVVYRDTLYMNLSGANITSTTGNLSSFTLLKDLSMGGGAPFPTTMTVWNDRLFFGGGNINNQYLWISDGTTDGTVPIKEVDAANFMGLDSVLVFRGTSPETASELWRTDGTEAGTFMLKDIREGPAGSYPAYSLRSRGVVLNNKALFIADDGVHGEELWVSDGTPDGTFLLKDIGPDTSHALVILMGQIGNQQIFSTNVQNVGAQLWTTDGTTEGTYLLKDFYPNLSSGYIGSTFAIYQGVMYFAADTPNILGSVLCKTDATPSGTQVFSNMYGGLGYRPLSLQMLDSTLMFTAANFDDGRELWKYEFAAPVADFEAPDTVCLGQPEYVSFSTFATGENWLWDFGADALPGTAQGKGPHDVKYTQAGTKTIHLIVSNPFGADTSTQILEVVTSVEPVFTFNQNGLIVSFINSSIGANSYFWQFGDGTTSTEPNPIHEYLQPGIYNVILEATNNCSSKSSMGTITPVSGSEEQSENIAAEIFPNPVYEQLWLNCPSCTAQTEFMVQDESGKIVQTGSVPIVSGTLTPLQVDPHLVSGVYYLILLTKHVQALPFFIQK